MSMGTAILIAAVFVFAVICALVGETYEVHW